MRKLYFKIHDWILSFFTGQTVGVRVMIIFKDEILLVKHTYRQFWYMPGGRVDGRESPIVAAKREVFEETNVEVDNLELFGFYYSIQNNHDDYVALYIAKLNEEAKFKADGEEISQIKWFKFNALPNDISPATKRRIDEYFKISPKSDLW